MGLVLELWWRPDLLVYRWLGGVYGGNFGCVDTWRVDIIYGVAGFGVSFGGSFGLL